MEYRNIGGRSNKKYYSNKSNSNRYKFLDNYSNDINQLLSGIADADREITKLKKEHDKLSRKQMQTLEDIEKQRDNFQKRLNRIGNKTKQNLTSSDVINSYNESLLQDIQREQNKYKNLSTWYADKQETKLMNRMNAARSQLTTEYINKNAYDSKGNYIGLTAKQTEAMNKEINDKLSKQFSKDIKQFDKSVKAFSTSTGFISSIFETFLRTTYDMGKRAVDKQASIYEDTFSNISVRTGMSRSQYYSAQRGIRSNLTSRGLLNNVGADELQTMWDKMSSNGINLLDDKGNISDAQIYANAIDLVVTNKIVPYLDTTSKSVQMLDSRVDGKFVRDIRGINLANNELVGNNYMTQEILQKMIDFIEPMSDAAIQQLAQSSEEMTAYANYLASQGLSQDQITQLVNTTFKARNYGYNMLANGSTYEKMIMANSMINNINPNNPNQLNDFTAMVAGNNQFWASMSPGYNTAINSVISSAIGNAVGLDYSGLQTGLKLNEKGVIPGSVGNTNLTEAQVKQYASTAYEEFALKDKNQTNRQLQNITLGNFMTELAVVKEWMGEYSSLLEKAIDKIFNLLLTGSIAKGIGKLASGLLGGGSSSILSFASSGLLALVGIEAAVEIGARYWEKQTNVDTEAIRNDVINKTGASELISNLNNNRAKSSHTVVEEGFHPIQWIKSSLDQSQGFDEKALQTWGISSPNWAERNILHPLGKTSNLLFGTNFNDSLTNAEAWDNTKMNAYDTHDWGKYNAMQMYELLINNGGQEYGKRTLLSIYAAINSKLPGYEYLQNALRDSRLTGVETELSADEIKAAANELGYSIKDNGLYFTTDMFVDNNGNKLHFDLNTVKSNYYRYGLSSVPYDNYPAILHQDEAVLTASTANELRNLIVEYRETNNQSINFEAIIQQQTTSLISKLNEVVTAINNINIGTGNNNRLSIVRNKLNNSMITVTSTKSFA